MEPLGAQIGDAARMEIEGVVMTRLLLGTVSYLALVGLAAAADMPVKVTRVAAPAMSWAGCYIGAHGAVVAHRDSFYGDEAGDVFSGTSKKTVGGVGGQIGCNWQDQNLVYGIEGDATWFRARQDLVGVNDTDYNYRSEANWLGTIRGRVGITAGSGGMTLLYLTGGAAFGGVKDGVSFNYNSPSQLVSKTLFGWTVGFGAERMLTRNWTIKAEALYVDLGSNNFIIRPSGNYNNSHAHELVVGRVGLNYKF